MGFIEAKSMNGVIECSSRLKKKLYTLCNSAVTSGNRTIHMFLAKRILFLGTGRQVNRIILDVQ